MSKQNFPFITHLGSAVCGDGENAAVLWGDTEIEDGSSMTFQIACGPPIIGRALNIDVQPLFRIEKDQTHCCYAWEQGGRSNPFKIKNISRKPSCALGCKWAVHSNWELIFWHYMDSWSIKRYIYRYRHCVTPQLCVCVCPIWKRLLSILLRCQLIS